MNVVYLSDADYQDWLAKRGGKPGIPVQGQTTQQQQ